VNTPDNNEGDSAGSSAASNQTKLHTESTSNTTPASSTIPTASSDKHNTQNMIQELPQIMAQLLKSQTTQNFLNKMTSEIGKSSNPLDSITSMISKIQSGELTPEL